MDKTMTDADWPKCQKCGKKHDPQYQCGNPPTDPTEIARGIVTKVFGGFNPYDLSQKESLHLIAAALREYGEECVKEDRRKHNENTLDVVKDIQRQADAEGYVRALKIVIEHKCSQQYEDCPSEIIEELQRVQEGGK